MSHAAPMDANGREIRLGDWVRVIQAPLSVRGMPSETFQAFSSAIGYTFQVEEIAPNGELVLELWPKISLDTIWLEPYCCVVYRRPAKLSKRFRRILERNASSNDGDAA
jgi:hypothetical protein